MRVYYTILAAVMLLFQGELSFLKAQAIDHSPNVSIPVARAVPALPDSVPVPVLEKGYDGKSNDPMLPISVSILSPRPQEIVMGNEVDFFFEVQNYTLAAHGNRLHAILDNQSPLVIEQLKRPLKLKNLSPGGHTLRVFAVTPEGRMIADPQAFAMVYFYVGKKDFQNYINPNTPFLTLNTPFQGVIESIADEKVWLDYRIHSTQELNRGFKVRYRLSNIQGVDDIGKGVFWQNLKVGRYDVSVELVDSNGSIVPGLFNRVQRSFEVKPVQKAISTSPTDMSTQPAHE